MIREYEKSDWEKVKPLYEQHVEEWKQRSGYPRDLADGLFPGIEGDDSVFGTVEIKEGEIRGFVLAIEYAPGIVWLSDIYFTPELRCTAIPGLAYRMFSKLMKGRGYKYVIGGTSRMHKEMAQWFYRDGFKTGDVHYYKELT